ncbi:flagellar biosynthesis protein FliQ [Marinospirillum alkaliphilum]|uniref:Flagellar biosynthetic protein FliQ n=1 Tax=Marinospirillum alkaliphilum DSM 21637 TaxID=1122209 RepID=A0A1K1VB72_9GAMM|nr:flagellar biosynthesis protein FliQ [Marinospirillum alkaliphilum]SFX22385.1 flagellar biosynthetic protein FliQ [Marinospirillum alkaliphilum DSM 21637]
MSPEVAVDLLREALFIVITIVAIGVVPGLLVGLAVAIFQAATQINEQTLSFLPRLMATLLALIIAGPMILRMLMEFFQRLADSIPYLIG